MRHAAVKILDMAKEPKSWIQLLVYVAVIFVGGWQVHSQVMEDLDKRLLTVSSTAFPLIEGEDLKDEVRHNEDHIDKRLDSIETDIKELLKRKK